MPADTPAAVYSKVALVQQPAPVSADSGLVIQAAIAGLMPGLSQAQHDHDWMKHAGDAVSVVPSQRWDIELPASQKVCLKCTYSMRSNACSTAEAMAHDLPIQRQTALLIRHVLNQEATRLY